MKNNFRDNTFDNVICKNCGYQNKKNYAEFFGICNCCGNVIDEKAKFKHEMIKKLGLWRKDKIDERKLQCNNN